MKKFRFSGVNIGTSSILIIMVTLTMVCFSCLSLSSANADYKLCTRLADRTSQYYDSVSKAYINISKITKESSDSSDNSFEFNIPMNEYQDLFVSGNILSTNESSRYTIDDFKIVTVNEPKLDNSLSLLLIDKEN